MLYVILI